MQKKLHLFTKLYLFYVKLEQKLEQKLEIRNQKLEQNFLFDNIRIAGIVYTKIIIVCYLFEINMKKMNDIHVNYMVINNKYIL